MKITHKILWAALGAVVVLVGVVVLRTAIYPFEKHNIRESQSRAWSEQISQEELTEALRRVAGGVRIPTVSTQNYQQTNLEPFDRFKAYLVEVYPVIHQTMDTTTINEYGLLYRWAGVEEGREPLLFLAHYDVVPISGFSISNYEPLEEPIWRVDDAVMAQITESPKEWSYHPFSGAVADGRIYGRGTLDDKSLLFALLEAAESLIDKGFVPEQDIWFAFGHDEEVGGEQGAVQMAKYFYDRGMRFEAVYDEGGIITAPGVGGINSSLALVGTAEKGAVSVKITVRGPGGHSSMPPAKSSLVLASEIAQKLNDNQMPARIIPPVASFLQRVGAEMNYLSRMAIANQWLMRPLLLNVFSGNSATNAIVRTTTAITMAKGSDAANVISSAAEIVVNFRILPGDSVAGVITHIERLCEGYDAEIEVISARESSNISAEDTPTFEAIRNAISMLYPETITTSYITVAATDAYKYETVSDNVYRLFPAYLNDWEKDLMHNEDEHITIENYAKMIAFYKMLFKQGTSPTSQPN